MKEERYAGFVQQKYDSLKMDLTSNKISIISMEMFVEEYRKAQSHFNSFYRKLLQPNEWLVTDQKKELTINHLLSVMIYCNFDQIQYHFSKTYRRLHINERKNEIKKRHSEFFHLGKYLQQTVHWFGTRIKEGIYQSFYHGIDRLLIFPFDSHFTDIYSPLSTSKEFEVAVNFANDNNGIIVEFTSVNMNTAYFSCDWLP
eukprot:62160_1